MISFFVRESYSLLTMRQADMALHRCPVPRSRAGGAPRSWIPLHRVETIAGGRDVALQTPDRISHEVLPP
jgi:hypothetical protein